MDQIHDNIDDQKDCGSTITNIYMVSVCVCLRFEEEQTSWGRAEKKKIKIQYKPLVCVCL